MYFPYLRGRQFELIAIRELLENNLISDKIIPIIEPVRASSTLLKTIVQCKNANQPLAFIINPQVGSYLMEINGSESEKQELEDAIKGSTIKACIVDHDIANQVKNLSIKDTLFVVNKKDYIDLYRRSISQMSINLKKLYSERKNSQGFAFSPDNDVIESFENDFPFELTEDQALSLSEIKKDMESKKIMDRLLLGDVGFGKTEVAIRAAFKAVMDGKQVAFVAPTTVLVEQHFKTVGERCKKFGVNVGVLDRFQKPSEIKKTLTDLENGKIDIIVGTHKLFGKDVRFKDLGLLILDEEQRFGVEHKEKLRDIKRNVDTLTMSATPIPRTLHMSLSGIRDISLIMTPPVSRIPVQSYVAEESDALIRDAVVKEMARNGQTFILYNNVQGMDRFYERVKSIIPEAKIVVGHGQMTREQLEDNKIGRAHV